MTLDEKLINLVKEHPILYDVSNKHYYDVNMKEKVWNEISENFTDTPEVLKKRWTSLRDCFRKALLKRKSIGYQKGKLIRKWKYEEQMSFLKPHFGEHVRQVSNIPSSSDDENGEYSKSTEIYLDNSNEPISIVKEEDKSEHNFNNFETSNTSFDPLTTVKSDFGTSTELDHLGSFFKAMEATVRTFSPLQQVQVKSQIYSYVSNIEMNNVVSRSAYDAQFSTSSTPTSPVLTSLPSANPNSNILYSLSFTPSIVPPNVNLKNVSQVMPVSTTSSSTSTSDLQLPKSTKN